MFLIFLVFISRWILVGQVLGSSPRACIFFPNLLFMGGQEMWINSFFS